jgi:hypothetical protein
MKIQHDACVPKSSSMRKPVVVHLQSLGREALTRSATPSSRVRDRPFVPQGPAAAANHGWGGGGTAAFEFDVRARCLRSPPLVREGLETSAAGSTVSPRRSEVVMIKRRCELDRNAPTHLFQRSGNDPPSELRRPIPDVLCESYGGSPKDPYLLNAPPKAVMAREGAPEYVR